MTFQSATIPRPRATARFLHPATPAVHLLQEQEEKSIFLFRFDLLRDIRINQCDSARSSLQNEVMKIVSI